MSHLRSQCWAQAPSQSTIDASLNWIDGHETHSVHYLVETLSGRLVASARVCVHTVVAEIPDYQQFSHLHLNCHEPIASINRLVIHPEYRGRAISRYLDEVRVGEARTLGAKSVLGQAAPWRVKQLASLGFKTVGYAIDSSCFSPPLEFTILVLDIEDAS